VKELISRLFVGMFVLAWASSASAILYEVTNVEAGDLDPSNDCAGYFTTDPGECYIFRPLDGPYDETQTLVSPAIAKFGVGSTTPELYGFASIRRYRV
jgi:hypothetical protein